MQEYKWDIDLFPLNVLYSPILKLRYRVALDVAINRINVNSGKHLLNNPIEFTDHHIANNIELDIQEPTEGSIYVYNAKVDILQTETVFFLNKNGDIQAVKILLPVAESEHFKEITYIELLNCLKL